ncbi:hypothetical protein [Catenibacterium mitsuokai]|uniref:hypothetical protein n=1 Tax=Catenibacterium mitsuokai TaxID=100886 RepID=UPI002E78651B|nr:hypothetical protein [Catenibacterium mitsuokai]
MGRVCGLTHHLRKMTFEGKSYNVLTDEELEDLVVSVIYDRKYKEGNVELVDFDQFVKDREEKYGL